MADRFSCSSCRKINGSVQIRQALGQIFGILEIRTQAFLRYRIPDERWSVHMH
jgi:hypothetical protein